MATFAKALVALALFSSISAAQKFKTLYNFQGEPDGSAPAAGLTVDAAGPKGPFFGTTFSGGATNSGTVFGLTARGKERVIHSFTSATDGANPGASLLLGADGRLYGTTENGGKSGFGTVFALTSNGAKWKFTVIHTFTGKDGAGPRDGLVTDGGGNLYGTTYSGGDSAGCTNCGTVFKLTPKGSKWAISTLHNFGGSMSGDGANPSAGLAMDSLGNLYGTTVLGGAGPCGCGTIFALAPSGGGSYRLIDSFAGGPGDGSEPVGGLILDEGAGLLYGSTFTGGSTGNGTVFQSSVSGPASVIYSFGGGTDGANPVAALLLAYGNLYGTTVNGGTAGDGTVFSLTMTAPEVWSESVLHSFTGVDGANPLGSVIFNNNILYGTASAGGAAASSLVRPNESGNGTAFICTRNPGHC
jgi:uncharacterized repeat protein (TIGR03803 family)